MKTTIKMIGIALMITGFLGCTGEIHRTDKNPPVQGNLDEKSIAQGKQLYQKFCEDCHGPQGYGNGPMASKLRKTPANLRAKDIHVVQTGLSTIIDYPHYSEQAIKRQIKYGNEIMPPLKKKLSEQEIQDLTNFLMQLIYKPEMSDDPSAS